MRLWLALCLTLLIGLATPWQAVPAAAQGAAIGQVGPTTPSASPPAAQRSLLTPRPEQPVAAPPSGPLAGLYVWIAQQMRWFNQTLAKALRDIKAGDAWSASLTLILFSFAYGVLHAAGPGHGKAIVSSYMLADGQTVRRGVQLAFLSSFVQAVVAVGLFATIVLLFQGARTQIVAAEVRLEQASWLLVALLGAWLLGRQLLGWITGRGGHHHHHDHGHGHGAHGHHHHHGHRHEANPAAHAHAHAHTHTHGHAPGHAHAHAHAHAPAHAHVADHGHRHAEHHGHAHHHNHTRASADAHAHQHGPGDTCAGCCHNHLPGPEAVQGQWSWRRASALALTIGMRPCTGAIAVLFLANGLGLLWAGVASTFMMSLGTAITVSALAMLTVGARDVATRVVGVADNQWAARAESTLKFVGALLVFTLGASFFWYSLSNPTPF